MPKTPGEAPTATVPSAVPAVTPVLASEFDVELLARCSRCGKETLAYPDQMCGDCFILYAPCQGCGQPAGIAVLRDAVTPAAGDQSGRLLALCPRCYPPTGVTPTTTSVTS